ncbi:MULTISPECIES: NAD(+) diphosphatase [Deefgea]|uniref:NAD(+) diphosphatase n=1 Tax=Deefgea chitinilytica TaxID=570276 RepID=A0ABS2CBK2_9NEIS|nr:MULTISPECIES: NAD(+) diphosphatase [Deefgea]MBM5571528.1 NAD(+) diphosphatase [Deefgea chitinilytica]MBM9888761.1 NAD(+) diphosphatase [Deefgea sp. CFH1-16]
MLPMAFIPAHKKSMYLSEGDIIIAIHGNTLLLQQNTLASAAALDCLAQPKYQLQIGQLESQAVHMAVWDVSTPLPDELTPIDLRASFDVIGETLWALAGRAFQIATFYRTHQFCGVCGEATQPLEHEAACECTACGHRVWPRVSPAVMVLIQRGREMLLARSPHFREGMYSAIAGFVEPGESLEQCAHREVLEEVGVTITNLRWFESQSWAFPHSLMLAFFADYVAGEIVCQPDEIEDARWFSPDDLPPLLPGPASIAYRLLQAGLKKNP